MQISLHPYWLVYGEGYLPARSPQRMEFVRMLKFNTTFSQNLLKF